jgi:hypothetical protein
VKSLCQSWFGAVVGLAKRTAAFISKIDHQLEFHGLLDWQVATFLPLRLDPA